MRTTLHHSNIMAATFRASVTSVICLLFTVTTGIDAQDPSWSYSGRTGPAFWCRIGYNKCCGNLQSPISLDHGQAQTRTSKPFVFSGYDDIPGQMTIKNDRYSVELLITGGNVRPYIHGGSLGSKYTFQAAHFHLGVNNRRGSEHRMDNYIYPMEVHLVHIREDFKNDIEAARKSKDANAVAVLAVFYLNSDTINRNLEPVTSQVRHIKYKEEERVLPRAIPLRSLLPRDTSQFFRYNGSLTTPSCDQIVTWTVFDDIAKMGWGQMEQFRQTYSTKANDDPPVLNGDNYRPLQGTNNRPIIHYWT